MRALSPSDWFAVAVFALGVVGVVLAPDPGARLLAALAVGYGLGHLRVVRSSSGGR